MEYLIAIIISLATGLAIPVLAEKAPRLSRWLVLRAARLYAEPKASRFAEEWLQHLATRDGPFSMLWHGLGCVGTGLRRGGYVERTTNVAAEFAIVFMVGKLFVLVDKLHGLIGIPHASGRGELSSVRMLLKHPKAFAFLMLISLPITMMLLISLVLVPLTSSRVDEVEMTRSMASDIAGPLMRLFGR